MTKDEILSLILDRGEENLLSVGFDNASIKVFKEDEFIIDENLLDDAFTFYEYDAKGNRYKVLKPYKDVKFLTFKFPDYPFLGYRWMR